MASNEATRPQEEQSLMLPSRAARGSGKANVWRVTKASRAALLFDGAGYFGALREAMRNARNSILIVGWDIDSRTRLVGESGQAEDGLPDTLAPFLTELVRLNPRLRVKLLLWDYAVLYALERERLPALALQWGTPPQVELCLDDEMPLGCSQHQKFVVVDDCIAFAGGLDVTIRRWDTSAHEPNNPARVDPAGQPYPPFHDMQMLVEGETARTLAELARRRWSQAACEDLPPLRAMPEETPWPASVQADFNDVSIGIARTIPAATNGDDEVREVENLFLDMIAHAETVIYAENQFLTSQRIAQALIARLEKNPRLEVLFVVPRTQHTWLEHRTMLQRRIQFRDTLIAAGMGDRVRITYPAVEEQEVMVHAKVMVVDDRWLRVGSANLANRSMGTDSECDLLVEARTEEEKAGIRRLRDRLIGEHVGASPEEVAEIMAREGSFFTALDRLAGRRQSLQPVDDGEADPHAMAELGEVADPERPLLVNPNTGTRSRLVLIGGALLLVMLATLAWRYTPLAGYLSPDALQRSLVAGGAWGPLIALGFFLFLGLIAFPVNVLIAGTAIAFGIWPGLLYAAAGCMVSALATYALGRRVGPKLLRRMLGPRMNRIGRGIERNGIMAVTIVRLMPVAPFTLVNLVAGAMKIRFLDYTLGTALGLAPGLVLMAAVGDRLPAMFNDPSRNDVLGFTAIVIAWIGVSFALQYLVRRLRRSRASAA
ncbi:VTT domain-containing protein [Acetobacteraceae bacterium H6797]|nr:VTT domain-containing protein [Acetobacteraceae bacterium H6797]